MAATEELNFLFKAFCDATPVIGSADCLNAAQNPQLASLQEHPLVWDLYQFILDHGGLSAQLYTDAGICLRDKMITDYDGLPPEQRASLRASLLDHIKERPGSAALPVCRCVGMLIKKWDDWEHALANVWEDFREHDDKRLLREMLAICIEVSEARNRMGKLSDFAAMFVQVVQQAIELCVSDPALLQDLGPFVCSAMAHWLHNDAITPEEVTHSFVPWLYSLISTVPAVPWLPEAIDALVTLSAFWSRQSNAERFKRTAELLDSVVKLSAVFDTYADDEEQQQRWCDMLACVAEHHMGYILSDPPHLELLEVIVDCTCSTSSLDVAAANVILWYTVKGAVDDAGNPALQERLRPLCRRVVGAVVDHSRYPAQLTAPMDLSAFRQLTRNCLHGCVKALCAIAGTEAVVVDALGDAFTAAKAELEADEKNWRGMEAAVRVLRSVASSLIDERGIGQPFTNQLLLMVFTTLPTLPESHEALAYIFALAAGRYSDWLNLHRECVAPCLSYVVSQLNRPQVVAAAALAFKNICDACPQHLAQDDSLAMLFKLYDGAPTLHINDQKEIIWGLCCVISKVPPDKQAAAVHRLIAPIGEDMTSTLAMGKDSSAAQQDAMHQCLDRLAEVCSKLLPEEKNVAPPVQSALASALKKLDLSIATCIHMFKDNDRIMERWCRVWKYAIRTCGAQLGPMLNGLVTMLADHMTRPPQASMLYLFGICVAEFASLPQHGEEVKRIVQLLLDGTLPHISDRNGSLQDTPVVLDFLDALARVLSHRPELIVTDDALNILISRLILATTSTDSEVSLLSTSLLMHIFAFALGAPDMDQTVQADRDMSMLDPLIGNVPQATLSPDLRKRVFQAWRLHASEAIDAMLSGPGRHAHDVPPQALALFCAIDIPLFEQEFPACALRVAPGSDKSELQELIRPLLAMAADGASYRQLVGRAMRVMDCVELAAASKDRAKPLEDD